MDEQTLLTYAQCVDLLRKDLKLPLEITIEDLIEIISSSPIVLQKQAQHTMLNTLFAFNVSGKDIVIVDERRVHFLDPKNYEDTPDKQSSFFNYMTDMYDLRGMILRTIETQAGRYYCNYNRLTKMFDTDRFGVVQLVENATIIVLSDKDSHQYADSYLLSTIATFLGRSVYYIVKTSTGVDIAKNRQFDLFDTISRIKTNEFLPYYLQLNLANMERKGSFVAIKETENSSLMFRRTISLNLIDETKYSQTNMLTCYKLSDIQKYINYTHTVDKYASYQEVDISLNRYMIDLKPTAYTVNAFYSDNSNAPVFESIFKWVFADNGPMNQILNKDLLPHLDTFFKWSEDKSKSDLSLRLNGTLWKPVKMIISSEFHKEYLQQICNALSGVYFNFEKPVYLRDVAIFKYGKEVYVTVGTEAKKPVYDFETQQTFNFDGEVVSNNYFLQSAEVCLVRSRTPLFTNSEEWHPYTKVEIDMLMRAVYSYLTQFSEYDANIATIPQLGSYSPSVFPDSDDKLSPSFYERRILQYNSGFRIKGLSLPDYHVICTSYKDCYLDLFGEISSHATINTRSVNGGILIVNI